MDFVDLMSTAITATDGSEAEALTMFELQLIERGDPALVWELFEPVRAPLLRRLYGMAKHQITQASEAQPRPAPLPNVSGGTASEPHVETVDSPSGSTTTPLSGRHSAVSTLLPHRRTVTATNSRSPRGADSAQAVIMSIGGKKSHLDYLTNHRGIPIGDLTYMGLANSHDEAPMFQRYAGRLMESGIPKTGRASDIVRKFITPDEADRMWLDLLKEVA